MDKNMYEEDFKRLLNRTLISYPFFEKSDSELIIDSKEEHLMILNLDCLK